MGSWFQRFVVAASAAAFMAGASCSCKQGEQQKAPSGKSLGHDRGPHAHEREDVSPGAAREQWQQSQWLTGDLEGEDDGGEQGA